MEFASATEAVRRYFTTLTSPPSDGEVEMTDASSSSAEEMKLEALIDWAKEAGYESLSHATQAEAEKSPTAILGWVASGGLGKFLLACQRAIPARRSNSATGEANRNTLLSAICAPACEIYLGEWRRLIRDPFFKVRLTAFSPESIMSFSFAAIYEQMQSNAPCLITLFQSLASAKPWTKRSAPDPSSQASVEQDSSSEDESDGEEQPDNDEEKARRRATHLRMKIVVALCLLGNTCTSHFNILQGMFAYVLYGYRVPRRAISICHRLGLTCSYSALRKALKSSGKVLLEEIRKVAAKGRAFWISCDNCTFTADVKNERLHHQKQFKTETVAYLVEPIDQEPHFTPDDINYSELETLNVRDVCPTAEDKVYMEQAAKFMIWEVIKKFALVNRIVLPALGIEMPVIRQLSKQPPKIRAMRTYPYDEGKISDMIKILNDMAKDVGMSKRQKERNVLVFKGDFTTTRNQRYFLNSRSDIDYQGALDSGGPGASDGGIG
jgi:hypothetical protein